MINVPFYCNFELNFILPLSFLCVIDFFSGWLREAFYQYLCIIQCPKQGARCISREFVCYRGEWNINCALNLGD